MNSKSSTLRQCRQEDLEEIWAPVKGYQLVKAEVISNFRLHQLAPSHVKLARGILLFGPSGTGKTEMARCIGRQFGATGNFHSVNSSDVISAYRGESGLNMKIVFDKAKEQEGVSVICFDEFEMLVPNRNDSGHTGGADGLLQEIFVNMSGLKESSDLVIIAITNKPWMLDSGLISRFTKRIYVPLPDDTTREEMFRAYLHHISNIISDRDFKTLAARSEALSGRDIKILLDESTSGPAEEADLASHFCPAEPHPGVRPCLPGDRGAIAMRHEVAVAMGVTYRPLTLADIKIRPTAADGEELTRLAEWNKKFGTFTREEAEVAVPQSGGCLALRQQPCQAAVMILILFILFWVAVVAVYHR